MKVAVVDLFCGVGGLTHGLSKAGLKVVAGIDNDPSCQYAYEANNKAKFIKADVSEYPASKIKSLYNDADIKILVGCAPCQTFSAQVNKYRKNKDMTTDSRWNLLRSFSEYIRKIKPEIVSMENVPDLRRYEIFSEFVQELESWGYSVTYQVIDCDKYGLPQKRRRLVLLASKLGDIEIAKPNPKYINNKKTVREALKDLPPIKHGQSDSKDPLHRSAGLTPINAERIKQSKPGGTWHDWDKSLLTNCHKKDSGKDFTSVYGRMKWDEPAPTITTQFFYIGAGRYGHPEQDRAISLREGALLQTFPKSYKFFLNPGDMALATISRHIGNAVPVDLGKIIGASIKKHLKKVQKCQKQQD